MTILKHENFPEGVANVIRHLEYWQRGETRLFFPQQLYGNEVKPDEWLACVGKPNRLNRPIILTLDPGIKENTLSRKAMQKSGCSFIVFLKAWADKPIDEFAWRGIKAWSDIVNAAQAANDAGRQCTIEVSLKGRATTFNL